MNREFATILLIAFVCLWPIRSAFSAENECTDADAALNHWRPIKEQAAVTPDAADELALSLLHCLGSPNPELRDGIGYELYTFWLRNELLNDSTRRELLSRLSETMLQSNADVTLARSFSALILAELMRSDAKTPFMTKKQREMLLEHAIVALANEQDFRGLDPEVGWIHSVAHIGDLLWRFALHTDTDQQDAEAILTGVRTKVAPTAIAFHFNESDRLARVVSTLLRRKLVDDNDFVMWISTFAAPQSMEQWSNAFDSVAGMYELHNTKQFLRALSDQLVDVEGIDEIKQALGNYVMEFTALI